MADPHTRGARPDEEAVVMTGRLELRPLPAAAARALPNDRELASRVLGAELAPAWPLPDLLDVLPLQSAEHEHFGVWVMIERETHTVIGDAGFFRPPNENGVVEIGYSVVPDRRRRRYATEAVRALTGWALRQDGVETVVAGCHPGNAASIGTLERIGFQRAGESGGELRWTFRRR